ncbi:MAG TPA: hypothetical protein VEB63_06050 [Chitinophagaceae bacterium]|nr:hypothetical protein [Chitinophagaceae bacterium]
MNAVRKYLSLLVAGMLAVMSPLMAQHDEHLPPRKPEPKPQLQPPKDTVPVHEMQHEHVMPSHAFSRNLPMNRNGSGTGWNPDAGPMYMWMKQTPNTDWMFHGSIFMRYTSQDIFSSGNRGSAALSFPNWFMAMMNHRVGNRGLLNATAMISLDRLTEGGNGYPLLFQSGETWQGKRLVDRQHPHDLFSGLSLGYTHMISSDADVFGYFGYPGEPALGAVTFMHRVSAMNNPDAPLGHHWQDATHITFGIGTLGFRYRKLKLEGSIFTGREPDENRFDFDEPRFDSYSYRVSYNPASEWALQFSQGFIKSPEAIEPEEDLVRTSASVLFAKQLPPGNHVSAAGIWGHNRKDAEHSEHSFLLEGNYQCTRNAFYSRYEYVQKSREELDLGNEYPHRNFNIHALTAGVNRRLTSFSQIDFVAGTQFTLHGVDEALRPLYGKFPIGFQLYLQLRPSLHKH